MCEEAEGMKNKLDNVINNFVKEFPDNNDILPLVERYKKIYMKSPVEFNEDSEDHDSGADKDKC